VGPTGSGKSTFVKLLQRLYDVQGGRILVDGQDIALVRQDDLRRAIAVVPQDPALFHRSIAENIGYARPDATDDEIALAARRARAHDFIASLPKGYETLVGERGLKLSGGEKQRVILARALAQQPRLLILDEPTNHLDPRYQLELLQLVRRLKIGTLASIHDLNLAAAFCDRLYVIEGGRIVASGTPHEVLTVELLREVFGVQALVDTHPLSGYPRITWITHP